MILLSVIYIDVLLVLNMYVTYFLLKAASKISHTPVSSFRVTAASVAGSLSSMIILADINFFLIFLIKISVAFVIVIIAFGKQERSHYIKLTASFFTMNFIFAGIIMGLGNISDNDCIYIRNTVIYYDISLTELVVLTAVSYFLICGIRYVLDRSTVTDSIYYVCITNGERSVSVRGLADTGNSLVDAFSGKPVIICSCDILFELTGKDGKTDDIYAFMLSEKNIKGTRLVPFNALSGEGTVPAFIPDRIVISNENTSRNVDALIGINNTQKEAIFNPRLIL